MCSGNARKKVPAACQGRFHNQCATAAEEEQHFRDFGNNQIHKIYSSLKITWLKIYSINHSINRKIYSGLRSRFSVHIELLFLY